MISTWFIDQLLEFYQSGIYERTVIISRNSFINLVFSAAVHFHTVEINVLNVQWATTIIPRAVDTICVVSHMSDRIE